MTLRKSALALLTCAALSVAWVGCEERETETNVYGTPVEKERVIERDREVDIDVDIKRTEPEPDTEVDVDVDTDSSPD